MANKNILRDPLPSCHLRTPVCRNGSRRAQLEPGLFAGSRRKFLCFFPLLQPRRRGPEERLFGTMLAYLFI
jgi:hypothetical protein